MRAGLAAPAIILPRREIIRPAQAGWSHGNFTYPSVPAVASANGLNNLIFYENFQRQSTFDLNKTGNPGYNWYLNTAWPNAYPPFGGYLPVTTGTPCSASNISVAGNTVALENGIPQSQACGFNLQTAQAAGSSYVGQGFVPPMYVQWTMQFNQSGADSATWPALWFTPLEFLTGSASAFVEVDGMEWYTTQQTLMAVHHWDMVAQSTSTLNTATVSPGVTDDNFHTFAFLWLPANGAVNGVVKRYLDGVEQTANDYSYASGSQGAASDTFHNMLIITPGDNIPVTFGPIQIWN